MTRSTRFSLLPATMSDAAPLAALHTSVTDHLTDLHGPGPWSCGTTERGVLHALRTARVYVARIGMEIVGTLQLATRKPWAIDTRHFSASQKPLYLIGMAVAPARQRQGIGRQCLEEAIRIGREWPADAIRLDAYDAKAGAGGFYVRCGWTETGRANYRGTALIYYELLLR